MTLYRPALLRGCAFYVSTQEKLAVFCCFSSKECFSSKNVHSIKTDDDVLNVSLIIGAA